MQLVDKSAVDLVEKVVTNSKTFLDLTNNICQVKPNKSISNNIANSSIRIVHLNNRLSFASYALSIIFHILG